MTICQVCLTQTNLISAIRILLEEVDFKKFLPVPQIFFAAPEAAAAPAYPMNAMGTTIRHGPPMKQKKTAKKITRMLQLAFLTFGAHS